jgi:hypothetical protein
MDEQSMRETVEVKRVCGWWESLSQAIEQSKGKPLTARRAVFVSVYGLVLVTRLLVSMKRKGDENDESNIKQVEDLMEKVVNSPWIHPALSDAARCADFASVSLWV